LCLFVACALACGYLARKSWGTRLDSWTEHHPVLFWISLFCAWFVTLPAIFLFFLMSADWGPGRWNPEWYWGLGSTVLMSILATGTLLLTFTPSLRKLFDTARPDQSTS